jgi:hypothetical protein
MDTKERLIDELKDLNDLEFEILFIDNLAKKLKRFDHGEARTHTQLLLTMSVVDSLKSYIQLAEQANREVPHKDIINMITDKCEDYLKSVADNEAMALYSHKSLLQVNEIVKELLFKIKDELVNTPRYQFLKPNLN